MWNEGKKFYKIMILGCGVALLIESTNLENHDWAFDINKQHTHHENRNPLDFTTRTQGFTTATSGTTTTTTT